MFDFNGKVALVSGGAKEIGFCIAKNLLQREAMGVALVDFKQIDGGTGLRNLKKEFGDHRILFIFMDVSERVQFDWAFVQAIERFKRLDIVINNAEIFERIQWEHSLSNNLLGCLTGSLLALDKYFLSSDVDSEKVILNVSSTPGLLMCEFEAVYTAVKNAIVTFSRSISRQGRSRNQNIKILTVCLGEPTTPILNLSSNQQYPRGASSHNNSATLPAQTAEDVADHIVIIIKYAESGTVWEVTGNITHGVYSFPDLNYPLKFQH